MPTDALGTPVFVRTSCTAASTFDCWSALSDPWASIWLEAVSRHAAVTITFVSFMFVPQAGEFLQEPGVQIRDAGPPASVSISVLRRLTNVAGSSSCPPSASVA